MGFGGLKRRCWDGVWQCDEMAVMMTRFAEERCKKGWVAVMCRPRMMGWDDKRVEDIGLKSGVRVLWLKLSSWTLGTGVRLWRFMG